MAITVGVILVVAGFGIVSVGLTSMDYNLTTQHDELTSAGTTALAVGAGFVILGGLSIRFGILN